MLLKQDRMEIKIAKKETRPLLSRDECQAEAHASSTPSNAELKKALADKLKIDEGLIAIKKINQKFGTKFVDVNFYAYSDKDVFKKFETKKEKKKAVQEPSK